MTIHQKKERTNTIRHCNTSFIEWSLERITQQIRADIY